jgi:MoaA/NifB/PqqE/SkfB family radical SAM enzyme
MPYDNHLEVAVRHAAGLGFTVNIHTNGLLLPERYAGLREWVDVYSLPVDGPDTATADGFRGDGYFAHFIKNISLLAGDRHTVAFNTFTSPVSIRRLGDMASLILDVAVWTRVEYWLISKYRPIGRADARKATTYGYSPEDFMATVNAVRPLVSGIEVFAQPTRGAEDPYPFRAWVLADGTVTVDLGSVAAPRN